MNEIIITNDDVNGHDDDNNNNDNDIDDDYVDDTSPNVCSVCDQQIDNNNNKCNICDQQIDNNNTKCNINNLLSRLLTTEGKNIAIALGETANHHEKKIIFLDKCKISLKKTPENNEKYNNYINSLVPLQTLILKHVSNIEKKISAWETEFCLQNNLAIPTSEDWEDKTKYLMQQLKYGKFLLTNAWDINL